MHACGGERIQGKLQPGVEANLPISSDYDYQVWLEAIPWSKVEAKMVSPGGWTEADIGQHLIRGRLERPVEPKYKGRSADDGQGQVS